MRSMAKALMDEFSIGVMVHSCGSWGKKSLCTHRMCLILLDNLKVDVVKIISSDCFDGKSVVLRFVEGA